MPIYGEEDPIKEHNRRLSERFPVNEGYKHIISYDKLVNALQRTKSVKEAATILGINYKTMRKYCQEYIDPDTGKNLFEKYKRPKGRGVRRIVKAGRASISARVVNVFKKHNIATQTRTKKLKSMLQEGQFVPLECEICGFNNRRLADLRSPLILNYRNGDPSDWRLDNIRYLCYNCYFLFVTDPISNDTLERLENEGVDYDFLTEKPKNKIDDAKQVNEIFNRHLDIIGVHGKVRTNSLNDDMPKKQQRPDDSPDDLVNYL